MYGAALTTGSTVEDVQTRPDRLRAVTAEAVRDAARKYLDKRRSVTGYLVKDRRAARGETLVIRLFAFALAARAHAVRSAAHPPRARSSAIVIARRHQGLAGARAGGADGRDRLFAFTGGANADPADKPGLANMLGALLDEGAGELDASAFQERMEEKRDPARLRRRPRPFPRLAACRSPPTCDEAVDLLRLALTAPRFDAEPSSACAASRSRRCAASSTNPNDIANKRWWAAAFPDHPYGRPSNGTLGIACRRSRPTI